DLRARYQIAAMDLGLGKVEQAEKELSAIVQEAPKFTEAHVLLATAYYRLKRKEDGDRERALVLQLNAETQAKQPKGDPLQPGKKKRFGPSCCCCSPRPPSNRRHSSNCRGKPTRRASKIACNGPAPSTSKR